MHNIRTSARHVNAAHSMDDGLVCELVLDTEYAFIRSFANCQDVGYDAGNVCHISEVMFNNGLFPFFYLIVLDWPNNQNKNKILKNIPKEMLIIPIANSPS